MGAVRVWWVVLLAGVLAVPLSAQEGPPPGEALRLFFDCQGFGCWDMDFFRREIPFVNWVRDREASDVHVLVTTQTTGGGGRQYRMAFLGRGPFDGQEQELVVNTAGDATDDEVRRAIAARLRLGLGRYLAGTPLADRLRVVSEGGPPAGAPFGPSGPQGARGGGAEDDPWNFWVFTLRGNAFLNGESSYSSRNLNSSFSANRTTDAWKLTLTGSLSDNRQTFDLGNGEDVEYTREERRVSGLVVKSLTDRLSAGARGEVGKSTFRNEDFRWSAATGLEVNVFPYSESSRRSLTFQTLLEARHWDYHEVTLFNQTEETRLAAQVRSELRLVQPWGNVSISAEHSRYLHDRSKWMAAVGGGLDVRLFKGFSVNMFGNYGWIRDQLYIPLGAYTEQEILLRQRALATNFSYYTMFGISYRFGSIFNNVVNPRFGGSSGGGMTIMF